LRPRPLRRVARAPGTAGAGAGAGAVVVVVVVM